MTSTELAGAGVPHVLRDYALLADGERGALVGPRGDGDTVAGTRWFERNRAACGPPGLFSEECDVTQRQLRGNLPQAFVHALMSETSLRLTKPWQDPPGGGR